MTTFLICLGALILGAVAMLILAGLAAKSLRGLNPEEWEE